MQNRNRETVTIFLYHTGTMLLRKSNDAIFRFRTQAWEQEGRGRGRQKTVPDLQAPASEY
eukprot:3122402-Rhodomonas_salina.4